MNITKSRIDSLKPTNGRPSYIWESKTPGFGVKVTAKGQKRFVFKYRVGKGRSAKQRWMFLGDATLLPISAARKKAVEAHGRAVIGEDPKESKDSQSRATLSEVWKRFEGFGDRTLKAKTMEEYRSYWRNHLKPQFGHRPIEDISRTEVRSLFVKMKIAPYAANRMLSVLSRLCTFAFDNDMIEVRVNPCRGIKRNKEESRTEFIPRTSLQDVLSAMSRSVAEARLAADLEVYFTALLHTGCRKNELLTAKHSWVSEAESILKLPDSKGGKRRIPLGPDVLKMLLAQAERAKLLGSPFLFPGKDPSKPRVNVSKPWSQVRTEAGMPKVRIYDIRHTFGMLMVSNGSTLSAIGKVMGHKQARTTQRYAHVDDDVAMSAAIGLGEMIQGN